MSAIRNDTAEDHIMGFSSDEEIVVRPRQLQRDRDGQSPPSTRQSLSRTASLPQADSPLSHIQASDDEALASDDENTLDFSTSGLPPFLQQLAASPSWIERYHQGPRRTGAQLLRDPEHFPAMPASPELAPSGHLLRCGPRPSGSSSSSSSASACYPNPLLAPFLGCSTLLFLTSQPFELVTLDFLLIETTETSIHHSHVRERGWTVALPKVQPSSSSRLFGTRKMDQDVDSVSDLDNGKSYEGMRLFGCGCEAEEVECFGCGTPIGFTLIAACPFHAVRPLSVVVFDPSLVHFVPPSILTGANPGKRKRSSSSSTSTEGPQPLTYTEAREQRTEKPRFVL